MAIKQVYHYDSDSDILFLNFPVNDIDTDNYIELDDNLILFVNYNDLPRGLIINNASEVLNIENRNNLYEQFVSKVALSIASFTSETVNIYVRIWSKLGGGTLSVEHENVPVTLCNEHISISL